MFPFHPGTAGEGKTGRVNASESSYASLSQPRRWDASAGYRAGRWEAAGAVSEVAPAGRTPPPRGKEGTHPGRISYVRNTGTVRHEALHDRAEMKGLRRRVVAATRLELRAA